MIDLNLLPALHSLLRERHVSRAAQQCHLSQSAMSRILAKLRQQFGDELLVRAGNDYQLTPKAIEIEQQLNELLPAIQQLGRASFFSPTTATQTVRIASTDMDVLLLADQIQHIQIEAPNLVLSFSQKGPAFFDQLIAGDLDFAMTPMDTSRSGLHRQLIRSDGFVAVLEQSSSLTENSLDLDTYLAHRHGVFNVTESLVGRVDSALASIGKARNVTLRLPTFSQIPPLLKGSPLIFTLPESFAHYLASRYPIKILPLPFYIEPMNAYLYWHHRLHQSTLHRWLRDRLLAKDTSHSD
ncbi:LysR family transcriptional regulator [Bowmanella denitrificans]|uniref:LysR family transcriptional regulator n=1 Tax=Bowmanella denitrificans TaxID=366582 RepID=A0ABN0XRM6_9ALTE